VFVFDDSSPYYENVVVNKSIQLIGENKTSTVIDGRWKGDTLQIVTSSVDVVNVSVVNSAQSIWSHGISVAEQTPYIRNIHIMNCIVTKNAGGIRFNKVRSSSIQNCWIHNNSMSPITIFLSSADIVIANCIVCNNGGIVGGLELSGGISICGKGGENNWCLNISINDCDIYRNYYEGILLSIVKNAAIHDNHVHENNGSGIFVTGYGGPSYNISIYDNIISGNRRLNKFSSGVYLQDCSNCVAIWNNMITLNAGHGVFLLRSYGHQIFENNFIDNQYDAFLINSNGKWKQNYWERPRLLPFPVFGLIKIGFVYIPWINFDWYPAQAPYNIGG
jgi:parallel beta-helix repeat protein